MANAPRFDGGGLPVTFDGGVLPDGLRIDPTTGVLSGTPLTLTDAGNFIVTVMNDAGSTSVALNLAVYGSTSPFNYAENPAFYAANQPITPNVPSFDSAGGITYSVSPALPAGLTISPSTGVISGTPTMVQSQTFHTITATNPFSSQPSLIGIIVGAQGALTLQPQNAHPVVGISHFGAATFNVTASVKAVNDGMGTITDACEPITNDVVGAIALVAEAPARSARKPVVQRPPAPSASSSSTTCQAPCRPMRTTALQWAWTIPVLTLTQADGLALRTVLSTGPVTGTMTR